MNRKEALLTLLAAASAILHIWAEYHGPQVQVFVFKPLTMAFIILLGVYRATGNRGFYAYCILAGLGFSVAGDVFLMLPSDLFVQGLISFLIAHLFYIAAFTQGTPLKFRSWSIAPFAVYGLLIYAVLFPHLGELKIPVLIYVVAILVMGWRALERWRHVRNSAALFAFFGALLFILSDSVLALNRFREPFAAARLLTLLTYFSAQWLIARSIGAVPVRSPSQNP